MSMPLNPERPPHALLLATQLWPVGAKLGLALKECGFSVSLWSPRNNLLLRTGIVRTHYPYRALGSEATLERALLQAEPDLIVPCDEPAMAVLERVAAEALIAPRLAPVLKIIERSFGQANGLASLSQRSIALRTAYEGGAAVPASAPVSSIEELRVWLATNGFPAYLKADGTFAAGGVRPIHNYEEAAAAFVELHEPPRFKHAITNLMLYHEPSLVAPFLRRQRRPITVQRAVSGREANSAFFCWRGRILASLSMETVEVSRPRGPSTVLRRIHNPAMEHTARILAENLGLSGFYGLDFMIEESTGTPWLLEMNSRTTQIPHLALGEGHDLPAAAFAAVTGQEIRPRPIVTSNPTIALFPQEWSRDPASPYLGTVYHDVPWQSPALMRALLSQQPSPLIRLTRGYWRNRKQERQQRAAGAFAPGSML